MGREGPAHPPRGGHLDVGGVGGGQPEEPQDGLAPEERLRPRERDGLGVGVLLGGGVPLDAVEALPEPLELAPPRELHELVVGDAQGARLGGRDHAAGVGRRLVYVVKLRHANSMTDTCLF